jgi:hypothetical protein
MRVVRVVRREKRLRIPEIADRLQVSFHSVAARSFSGRPEMKNTVTPSERAV